MTVKSTDQLFYALMASNDVFTNSNTHHPSESHFMLKRIVTVLWKTHFLPRLESVYGP